MLARRAFLLLSLLSTALASAAPGRRTPTPATLLPRGKYDDSDGCPVGSASCSAFSCYPLDGSVCCADGTFCDPGFTCQAQADGVTECAAKHNGAAGAHPAAAGTLAGLLAVGAAFALA
ncbi:uncharacterized protein BXZ73DRAFT_102168 [Epithele typhae]|uniref:uncharacterized protein n=1 Tax=Epithele typhae TaxID=378194 RepID=UPI002007C647|nr:uncharacterized protein BXZ73DRAFT_102168 [Epithele typhae]KAH9929013.1 hypothetical protein BXZ73DRAFT_102168 [Epithele typhae]